MTGDSLRLRAIDDHETRCSLPENEVRWVWTWRGGDYGRGGRVCIGRVPQDAERSSGLFSLAPAIILALLRGSLKSLYPSPRPL